MDEGAVQQGVALGDEGRILAALQDLADDLGRMLPMRSLDIRTPRHGGREGLTAREDGERVRTPDLLIFLECPPQYV
jgi:hypothetical protein